MRQLLLRSGDAPRILTVDHVGDLLRKIDMGPLRQLSAFDDVDRDPRIHITDGIQVDVDDPVDLDDILAPHFAAVGILDERHLAVQIIKPQDPVKLHPSASLDMIQHDAVFNLSYNHLLHLQKLQNQCHPNELAVTHLLKIFCTRIIIHRS